jgi:hypothetical protein
MKISLTELRQVIVNTINIIENIQLADKVYFNTGKLSVEDKELLLSVTNWDNYSKLIADVIYDLKKHNVIPKYQILNRIYHEVKNYNKNIFPIKGFTDINKVQNIQNLIYSLELREKIIEEFKQIPSIGLRNLRPEIRKERNSDELYKYLNDTEYFVTHLSYLSNKDEKTKNVIYNKMFKNNTTMDKLLRFIEEKSNLIGQEVGVTKEELLTLINTENDYTLVYENNNVMIIRVESPEAIKGIGCNSLWCFTYGEGFDNAYKQWNNYSTNGMVYVIVDFRDVTNEDFMNVVIKPIVYPEEPKPEDKSQLKIPFDDQEEKDENEDYMDNLEDENDDKIFDLTNIPKFDAISYLKDTIGLNVAKQILTFEY